MIFTPYPRLGYETATETFLQDDFLSGTATSGSVGTLGWSSAGTISVQSSGTNRLGFYRIDTGATQAVQARVHLAVSALLDPSRYTALAFHIRLNTNDANTTIRIGAANGVSSDPPLHGVYFEKLDGDMNWFCTTRTAGVQTRTDSGVAINTSFNTFAYVRSTLGVTFLINGVPVVVNQADNVPVTYVCPFAWIINSAAAAKTFDIDAFQLHVSGLTR
jgi:hypothetical protein